jgi:LmbE family N-acetylglucosaminyl deacetylase
MDKNLILILAPHTDDGELGCGGSIAKFVREGKKVTYVAFSTCAQSLPKEHPSNALEEECRKATSALGVHETIFFDFEVRKLLDNRQAILEELLKINHHFQPHLVLLPARHDVHQDHQSVYAEGMRAFKNASILGYELPWNNTRFQPNYFEQISEEDLSKKIKALKEYKTQVGRSYMNPEFIRSLAVVRGIQCNTILAEAFEVYKMVK